MRRHILPINCYSEWMIGSIVMFVIVISLVSGGFLNAAEVVERDYFRADEDPAWRQQLNINNAHHTDMVLERLRQGNNSLAMEEAKFTLRYWPNHPRALILMEVIARATRAPSLPIPYYEKAVRQYPQYAVTHAQYGHYLVEIESVDEGIMQLQQAVEIDPMLGAAHAWLAEAYLKAGKRKLARKSAEQARELGYKGEIAGDPSEQGRK